MITLAKHVVHIIVQAIKNVAPCPIDKRRHYAQTIVFHISTYVGKIHCEEFNAAHQKYFKMGRPLILGDTPQGWLKEKLPQLDLMRRFLVAAAHAGLPQPKYYARCDCYRLTWLDEEEEEDDTIVDFKYVNDVLVIAIRRQSFMCSELNAAIACLHNQL